MPKFLVVLEYPSVVCGVYVVEAQSVNDARSIVIEMDRLSKDSFSCLHAFRLDEIGENWSYYS